jgi:enoyl-CoA hydratase/carnithine racemase
MSTSSLRHTAALIAETTGGVTRLTLNRPDKRNAMSRQLLAELGEELSRIGEDRDTHVVILAANGPAFSAGHDLGEMCGLSEAEYHSLFADCSRVMLQLRRLPQPVIARVQGLATAAGCQLAAACDLVVAADTAQFATPGVKIGLFCTTPMVPLVRAIPPKPALEMLMLGTSITAQRAYELGLVNRVVPAAELDAAVQQLVDGLLAASPLVLQLGKRAFYDQLALSEEAAYERAIDVVTENALCADAQEGFTAFLHKRKPQWRGR